MDGSESTVIDANAYETYRLSWLAYVKVILKFLLVVATATVIGAWAAHASSSEQISRVGMTGAALFITLALGLFVYKLFIYERFVSTPMK